MFRAEAAEIAEEKASFSAGSARILCKTAYAAKTTIGRQLTCDKNAASHNYYSRHLYIFIFAHHLAARRRSRRLHVRFRRHPSNGDTYPSMGIASRTQ